KRAKPGRLACGSFDRPRHQAFGGLELVQETLHVVDVVGPFLGIARVAVLAGAASEEGAARRVGPGKGAERDAVAVDVEIAAELDAGFELLRGHDLAAVVPTAFVPFERLDE